MSQDIDTLRKQLQQLQELHSGGAIDDEQYQQSKARLERRIVDAVVQEGATAEAAGTGPASPAAAATAPGPAATSSATASPAATPAVAAPSPAAGRLPGSSGQATPADPPPGRPSRRMLAGVAAFALVVTVAGYSWKGSPELLGLGSPDTTASHAGDGGHDVGNAQMAAMVEKLAERMKERPEDPEGWIMLARSYAVMDRFADAVPAYAQAIKLVGEDAALLADYADALGMVNNRVLGPDAQQVIDRALKADANNLKALSLAGSAAFYGKDYARAVQHWERLVEVAPAESPFLPDVRAGIAEARQRGSLGTGPVTIGSNAPAAVMAATTAAAPTAAAPARPGAAAAQAPASPSQSQSQMAQATPAAPAKPSPHDPPPAGGPATVSGTVTLAKSLAAQAAPTDTVFIFARAAEGPRMPLAIIRKQVKDLPVEFKLDDSHAMAPAFKLSSFAKVVVGARISKSGEAMPQKGDLTGITAPVATGSTGLKVEINQVVNP